MEKKAKHITEKQALLYVLKDLPSKSQERMKTHLEQCETCSMLVEEYRKFNERLVFSSRYEPSDAVLNRSRILLRKKLSERAEKKKLPVWDWIHEHTAFPSPGTRIAFTAAVFLFGFLTGHRVLNRGPRDNSSLEIRELFQSSVPLSNFRIIPAFDDTDQLEIHFLASRDFHLTGKLSDPSIQYALAYALVNDPRDNVRLKSLDLLGDYSQVEFIKNALFKALESDQNPGVRMKAITLLKTLPFNSSIKEVFIQTLFKDENSGVRIEAANSLAQSNEPDIIALLKEQAKKDEYMHSILYRKQTNDLISITENQCL